MSFCFVKNMCQFRCDDNTSMTELLQKYAGQDASHFINSSPHHLSLLQMLEAYLVGNYCQPEIELPENNFDSLYFYTTLIDLERSLGYLLGLHAYNLRQSLPLQWDEMTAKEWLNAKFLRAGLQVTFLPTSYRLPFGCEKLNFTKQDWSHL